MWCSSNTVYLLWTPRLLKVKALCCFENLVTGVLNLSGVKTSRLTEQVFEELILPQVAKFTAYGVVWKFISVHHSCQLFAVLNQIIRFQTVCVSSILILSSIFTEICKWSFFFRFHDQTLCLFISPPCMIFSCWFYATWFDHPNHISWRGQFV
jgi:hypothetical protein